MKNLSIISFLLILCFSIVSAQETPTYSIGEAVDAGVIKVEIRGQKEGGFYGKSLRMQIRNLEENDIQVEVESGQKLICDTKTIQNMIITESFSVPLAAGEKDQRSIYAMCGEINDGSPWAENTYQVGPVTSGNTYKIAKVIEANAAQDIIGQCAMWATTDESYTAKIRSYAKTQENLKKSRALLDEAGIKVKLNTETTTKIPKKEDVIPQNEVVMPYFNVEEILFKLGFWVVMGIAGICLLVTAFRKKRSA